MLYRVQVLNAGRWYTIGCDCYSMAEAENTRAAMCPHNASTRIVWVGC